MPLQPYAERSPRRWLQLLADLAVLAWVVLVLKVCGWVREGVQDFAGVGFRLRDGAGSLGGNLASAGSRVAEVPLVGDPLSAPLGSAAHAAGTVAGSGQQFGDDVTAAALPLAVAVFLLAAGPVLVPWLLLRLRYARRAGGALAVRALPGGRRLLALRALATQPPRRLAAVAADPVAAWEAGDPEVVAALARLELRRYGLREP